MEAAAQGVVVLERGLEARCAPQLDCSQLKAGDAVRYDRTFGMLYWSSTYTITRFAHFSDTL